MTSPELQIMPTEKGTTLGLYKWFRMESCTLARWNSTAALHLGPLRKFRIVFLQDLWEKWLYRSSLVQA
ncbi:hypothetical protein TNCV_3453101 [Trichonephila clavipes]|nr:hypothetical protein TNCV_3453101 [Trichonephila clavipes]